MSTRKFILENSLRIENNDTILSGAPYVLSTNTTFVFHLTPTSDFWRFGIRIGKNPEIDFYIPEHRYKNPDFSDNYIDLHIAVGDYDTKKWRNPDRFHICQYNLAMYNHLLGEYPDYNKEPVTWILQYEKDSERLLRIVCKSGKKIFYEGSIVLPEKFFYFKVFAWADNIPYKILGSIKFFGDNVPTLNENTSSIIVGRLLFRMGDMFDAKIVNLSQLILLPASVEGTATASTLIRASELSIPYPTKNKAGTISLFPVMNGEKQAGYAYSVKGLQSNPTFIEQLCINLLLAIDEKDLTVNLPLFGTGAGKLSPVEVADIYDIYFNNRSNKLKLIISIQNDEDFKLVRNFFRGRDIAIGNASSSKKPGTILALEHELNTTINKSAYETDDSGEVTRLVLEYLKIDLSLIAKYFPKLQSFTLYNCSIYKTHLLGKLQLLSHLYLPGTFNIDKIKFEGLKNLSALDLSYCRLRGITKINTLTNLRSLRLKGNQIKSIQELEDFTNLEILDISENLISNISPLKKMKTLKNLNISHNRIASISPLSDLSQLKVLDISNNRIRNVSPLSHLLDLTLLKVDKNPFLSALQLIIQENQNHLTPVINILARVAEKNRKNFKLPVKVLLLGNHASGKSSLLYYIQKGTLPNKIESTHIIKIERYPKRNNSIPQAVFYDFGGQDYYHGIYRAFLSGGAIYILLWNQTSNKNNQIIDRNGFSTQNFTLSYWLGQKNYLENQKFDGANDPIIIVQTHADTDQREFVKDYNLIANLKNDFFLSLKNTRRNRQNQKKSNELALNYFKEFSNELMASQQIVKQEPDWYINFIRYILNENSNSTFMAKDIEKEILMHYQRNHPRRLEFLKEDLDQLHKQGLILYYKNELPNIAWLNPSALVQYVHDHILSKAIIGKYHGRVPCNELQSFDANILNLLSLQKVIFLHEYGKNGPEYIIPNFLKFSNESEEFLSFLTLEMESPAFTLKFKHFIPFGLMNQLICFFGIQRDKKFFSRDQLIFVLEGKAKVAISIQFERLEIRAFISFFKTLSEGEKSNLKKYIFYGILGLYWDLTMLDYRNFLLSITGEIKYDSLSQSDALNKGFGNCEAIFSQENCRPIDLNISVDDKHFVNYTELCNSEESTVIRAAKIDDLGTLSDTLYTIQIYPFQIFVKRELKKPKKVVISYSKKDLVIVNKFKDFLVPLYDDGLIESPWYCTLLEAGRDWNEDIAKKFDDAEIIFFMISENLMATKYVKENEIKNAINKWNDSNKSIRIIPIVLSPYDWSRKGAYNLARFTGLPYMLKPVCEFKNPRLALHSITLSLRMMLEKDLYPGSDDIQLTSELKDIYERISGKEV